MKKGVGQAKAKFAHVLNKGALCVVIHVLVSPGCDSAAKNGQFLGVNVFVILRLERRTP